MVFKEYGLAWHVRGYRALLFMELYFFELIGTKRQKRPKIDYENVSVLWKVKKSRSKFYR